MHLFSPQSLLVLTLYLSSTVHCLHKSRRDTSDLKTDSLLAKVLGDSDVKKERKDRSIVLSQEPNTNAKWGQQAWSYFFGHKQNDKRAVNPAQEAMYNNRFQGVDRRSNIPTEGSSISQSADADSFPLHLNVHSPNARLKGAVPHFEEYGETVESVMKAQKRFKIPRPEEYSSEIVKKNDIPRPDDEDDEPVVHHKKKRSKVAKKQYVQYPQQQQFAYNPYASNLIASGDLYAQQNAGMMQFQQPAAAAQPMAIVPVANMAVATSHVQNLDGAIARPIVTEKVCDDQFALCNEYAKNNYCTDYEKQMRTQCRKSCNFCKTEAPVTSSSAATSTSEDDVSGSGEFSGSGEQEPMRRNLKAAVTGSKRHDILQERAKIRVPDRDESGDGSGSGSADGSGSASGSGDADTDNGPIEVPIQQNPMQEFHIPSSRKDSFAGPPPQSDSDDGSGSASGSGDESGDSQDNDQQPQVVEAPKPKISKKSKIPRRPKIHQVSNNKRSRIPNRPAQPVFYPKIDLKAIASSLAHYEEAALELAGEYPKISDAEVTEYTRSFIPHPESDDEVRANRNRQNIQIAKIITAERARKSNIPQFLKVTGDVKKPEKDESDAATLDSIQQRFIVPGVEPTLNDYYAETGKLNPFDKKGAKNYKKSRIEGYNANYDPYEYLRNMPAGASMEPIIDPHKRASIPSDHSYPVFLMKVSPTDEAKYVEEKAERRGEIRHFNAEGVEINNAKYQQMLHGGHPEMESAVRAQVAATRSKTPQAPAPRPQIPDFTIASKKATLPSFPAAPESAPAAYQQPSNPYENNFAQMQQNAMQQASLFPNNNQQFNYEQQPGPNNMRSKMFNAFFNVGANSSPEEGSGSGAGEGLARMNVI